MTNGRSSGSVPQRRRGKPWQPTPNSGAALAAPSWTAIRMQPLPAVLQARELPSPCRLVLKTEVAAASMRSPWSSSAPLYHSRKKLGTGQGRGQGAMMGAVVSWPDGRPCRGGRAGLPAGHQAYDQPCCVCSTGAESGPAGALKNRLVRAGSESPGLWSSRGGMLGGRGALTVRSRSPSCRPSCRRSPSPRGRSCSCRCRVGLHMVGRTRRRHGEQAAHVSPQRGWGHGDACSPLHSRGLLPGNREQKQQASLRCNAAA